MRFWDASAIIPLLLAEPDRDVLLKLLSEDRAMAVWWGTPVECSSALARREREGAIGSRDASLAEERLHALAGTWQEVLPSNAVRSTAQRLLRVHALRAADSLQLAAALVACEGDPRSLPFVCLDERLVEASGKEGFTRILTR